MEAIRIVLAEDHVLVREGTRQILEQQPDLAVVGEAGDGQEAIELVQRLQPDVAILDIRLPNLMGVDIVRHLSAHCPSTRALMLTAYDDDEYIIALMEAGASGYLLKTAKASDLVDAVRSVHLGECVLYPAIAAKVARLWRRRQAALQQEAPGRLSQREREVLELAAKGLRNKAIADQLCISIRTVEGHLSSILTKLGLTTRVEAVLYAVSQGWIELGEERRP